LGEHEDATNCCKRRASSGLGSAGCPTPLQGDRWIRFFSQCNRIEYLPQEAGSIAPNSRRSDPERYPPAAFLEENMPGVACAFSIRLREQQTHQFLNPALQTNSRLATASSIEVGGPLMMCKPMRF
jgi:hypothetical protein